MIYFIFSQSRILLIATNNAHKNSTLHISKRYRPLSGMSVLLGRWVNSLAGIDVISGLALAIIMYLKQSKLSNVATNPNVTQPKIFMFTGFNAMVNPSTNTGNKA